MVQVKYSFTYHFSSTRNLPGTNKILGSIVISGSQNRSVYRCTLEEKGIGGKKEQGEGQPGNLTVLFCVLYILFVSCNKKISSS